MWLLLATLGCMKPAPPAQAAGETVSVSAVQDLREGAPTAAPQRVRDRVAEVLRARNLEPRLVEEVPARGVTRLSRVGGDGELVLLVEAQSAFYAQMAGRYRWTVTVTASMAPRDHLEEAYVKSWEIPVFLQFYHQQEEDALAEAAPMIARHLEGALDEWLGERAQ